MGQPLNSLRVIEDMKIEKINKREWKMTFDCALWLSGTHLWISFEL
jgi:hypothetical protein